MTNEEKEVHRSLSVAIPLMTSCVLAVAFNTIVCYLIATFSSLKTATNVFVFSLCLCNIILAGIVLPIHIYFSESIYYRYLLTITIIAYICNMTAVTSERLYSITYPLEYIMIVTKKRTTMIATLAWVVSICYSLLPLIWKSDTSGNQHVIYSVFTLVVFLVGPLIFVCITYIKVCIEIKKIYSYSKKFKSNKLELSPCSENIVSDISSISKRNGENSLAENIEKQLFEPSVLILANDKMRTSVVRQLKSKMSELKSSAAFGIVALIYMLNWIPIFVITFLDVIKRKDLVPHGLDKFSIFFMAISALIDALIYALFLKNFRKTIKLIVRRFRERYRISSF